MGNVIEIKNASFVANVSHVCDKTRFKDSAFICTILQGEISKGDVVLIFDDEWNFIVEQEIDIIQHLQRAFNSVKKGEAKDDTVSLDFKHIWEYPIQGAKYIIKLGTPMLSDDKQKLGVTLLVNNELPCRQLITKTVDIDDFIKKFYIQPLSMVLGYYLPDIASGIGIECLRETELGALYSVHKVKQGGLLYIFYARIEKSIYVKVSGWYYVQKKLFSNDFAAIKKGSSISDVIAIDPAAQIYENIYNNEPFLYNIKSVGLDTYHFLGDGILKIHFANINQTAVGGEIRVTKKTFVGFDDIKSIQSGPRIHSLNGRILPMDMIDVV
jgi:hypothetical protein